ncbi:rapamycin-insensitive companion of mTOR-like [Liolophura sinensis]|uniref:rapamycin-insensitive companion of mTOR-like n=1 Tax=Liolophura sinensis TaxID=3198878 RepID=UPI00315862A6
MANIAVRHGRSSLRNGRFRGRHDSGEETVRLDCSKEPKENIREILLHIVRQHGISKSKKLAYLNAFVKYLYKVGGDKELPYSKEDIFCCLRIGLLHEAKEVRAATLRTIRYLLSDQESLDYLFTLHIDYLIARSLDVCLDNEVERVHAIRLIRKISQLNPHKLPPSLIYPLVAIGNDGAQERDRMTKVSLASICEIAFHNASVISHCGGVSAILHNIIDCQLYPRVNESLVATILYLLNHPRTRHFIKINIDLEQLVAPFTDCHYKHSGADTGEKSLSDDKESRFAASKMAIVTVMKSWPGMIRLCRPDGSGLQSLVGILYLPNAEIRKNIVDMLFELFRIQSCEWTSDFSVALLSTDPSQMRDAWRLSDGFVAEEGRILLSHQCHTRPNLVENHQALILSAWINAGILEALVEVITSSDGPLFVRTVILLGELVHLASTILPMDCSNNCQSLPTLMARASSVEAPPQVQHRASLAVNCLNRIHILKKRGCVPHSLYLEQLVASCRFGRRETVKPLTFNRTKLLELYCTKTASEDIVGHAVRDSQVLTSKEHTHWDWGLIIAILQWSDDRTRKLEDLNFARFIRRLVFFYKPTNHQFSALEQGTPHTRTISSTGCHLVDFLVNSDEEEAQKHIFDWLSDIAHCLAEISVSKIPTDAILSLSNINKTVSQHYFLLVGKFSSTVKGDKWLERSGVYQQLLELISSSCHEKYVKLTTSSLSYSRDGLARVILSKALTASIESGRLYSTKLLRVLLRAGAPYFNNWGVDFLVTQLYDISKSVAMAALHVLEEACELEANLESLVKMRPSLLHLGDKGALMLCRLLSVPKGFKYLSEANYVSNELEKWHKSFNTKYVNFVEELLNEALTTYEKTYDGSYTRRSSSKRPKKNAYVPFHLYGQLVQHKEGFNLLKKQEYLKDYVNCLKYQELVTDEDTHALKTALWALGHMGRSALGIGWLQEEEVIPTIIKLAEESAVFSIRGTAFYVLGLLASTRQGCQILAQFGWESLWHTRADRWPVLQDRDSLAQAENEENNEAAMTEESAENAIANLAHEVSMKLFFIEEEKKDTSDAKEVKTDAENSVVTKETRALSDVTDKVSRTSDTFSEDAETAQAKDFASVEGIEITVEQDGDTKSNRSLSPTLSDIARRNARLKAEFFERFGNLPKSQTMPSDGTQRGWTTLPQRRSTSFQFDKPKQRSTSEGDDSCLMDGRRTGQEKSTSDPATLKMSSAGDAKPTHSSDQSDTTTTTTADTVISFASSSSDRVHPCDSDTKKKITLDAEKKHKIFEVTTYKNRPSSLRDEGSSSNESNTTSKSRSDSFNTGSTTSGIGSCESAGPLVTQEGSTLSPIASTASLTSLLNKQNVENTWTTVHHSSVNRKRANLSRVPSLRRQPANPALGVMSPTRGLDSALENIGYASARDIVGYNTLRIIQRQRTYSSDMESDFGLSALYDEDETRARSRSVSSWKSTESDSIKSSIPKNSSYVSIQDYESSQSSPYNTWSRLPPLVHNKLPGGRAEFLGLCLPIDVTMVFEVNEGEDRRTASVCSSTSAVEEAPPPLVSHVAEDQDTKHDTTVCLACHRRQLHDGSKIRIHIAEVDTDMSLEDADPHNVLGNLGPSPPSAAPYRPDSGWGGLTVKMIRARTSSTNDPYSTAGSLTSTTDTDSTSKKMSEDSDVGRAIIRREIMRFITNLSSSVGTKGSEQGLLHLKRKFPRAFRDLCLYSDIAVILGSYSFRLNARRFIQELFDDLSLTRLLEEPRLVLGVTDDLDVSRMAVIRQDQGDEFAEGFG